MLLIDHYAYNNKLSSMHPGEKFIFFVLTIVLCLALTTLITSITITILMAGIIVFVAGIPWRFYVKLMLLPVSFLIIGVAAVAFSITKGPDDFIWAFNIGSYSVGIIRQGMINAVELFFRSLGAVSCLYFLALTTPLTELITILKRFRVPTLVIELMTLIYRCIFILLGVTGQIYTAQSSRLGYKNMRTSFNSLSQLVASMFIKSYRHSLTMYDSMASRCYNGNLLFLEEQRKLSVRNLLLIVCIDGVLVACSIYAGGIV